MNVRYRVELSQTERAELTALLSGGTHVASSSGRRYYWPLTRGPAMIARSVGVGRSTVHRTKRRFVLGNLEAALSGEPRPWAKRKLSGKERSLAGVSSPLAGRAS
jgi:Winged helix-turn helix